jgi:hypothetical protein
MPLLERRSAGDLLVAAAFLLVRHHRRVQLGPAVASQQARAPTDRGLRNLHRRLYRPL